jgi:hypothetical protein
MLFGEKSMGIKKDTVSSLTQETPITPTLSAAMGFGTVSPNRRNAATGG